MMSKGYDEEDGRGPYLVLCILFWLVTTACQAKSCWSMLNLQSSMGGCRYMIWLVIRMSCICPLIWGSSPGLWAGVAGSVSMSLLSSASSNRVQALQGDINSCQEDKRAGRSTGDKRVSTNLIPASSLPATLVSSDSSRLATQACRLRSSTAFWVLFRMSLKVLTE